MKTGWMKVICLPLLMAATAFSCKKDNNSNKDGHADMTLTVGSQELNITGDCGWAVAGGVNYVGAKDDNNSLRVFETNFNITDLPTSTTTYTLVDDQFDETPSHIWATFTEIQGSSYIEWTSFNGSGDMTLVVDGDKITVNLNGIVLEPGSANASPLDANGTLSGTLEFYRD